MFVNLTIKNIGMKLLYTAFCFLLIATVCQAQQHCVIGLNNDTLKGLITLVEKKHIVFVTETNEIKKIPHSSISKAIKNGLDYPVLNGRLSSFPFIDSEKAGFVQVVEVEGRSEADLYKQADEVVNSNSREFSRQAEGSTVATTYALLGVRSASTQVVDLMHKNETPVKYSDPNSHKLVVRVVNRYEGGGFGCVRIVWWEYDLILKFKDGRYRMDLTNFSYNHFNNANNAVKTQFAGLEDGGDCKSSGNIESLLRCSGCYNELGQMYTYLIEDAWKVMKLVKDGIEKQATQKDDDW
jgi:hypothetical protein